MPKTKLTIDGQKFRINGKLVYEEIAGSKPAMHGLLMNSRFIQGIFDSEERERFHRYGKVFDPDTNTDELIAALPQWYAKGLRAITVGMQGGGSCFTVNGKELKNNPYSDDGTKIDPAYLQRLDKLIEACDEIGMVVIVSYFYGHNTQNIRDAQAMIRIAENMTRHLKEAGYTNVIIEVANEQNNAGFSRFPILQEPQGAVALIHIIKGIAPDIPVGCSSNGGFVFEEICRACDVALIHGNGQTRSQLYNLIVKTKAYAENKPVLINEDSQAIGQLAVCAETYCSWGYFNNMTKQEPPTYWEITRGEDAFFAWRMADMLGIAQEKIPEEEQYYFQGFEPHMHCGGVRFPRVASLYPETINYVRFYENGKHVYTCYDESFSCNFTCNWGQRGVLTKDGDSWEAEIVLRSGAVKRLQATVQND